MFDKTLKGFLVKMSIDATFQLGHGQQGRRETRYLSRSPLAFIQFFTSIQSQNILLLFCLLILFTLFYIYSVCLLLFSLVFLFSTFLMFSLLFNFHLLFISAKSSYFFFLLILFTLFYFCLVFPLLLMLSTSIESFLRLFTRCYLCSGFSTSV